MACEAVDRLAESNARVRNHLGAMLDRLEALRATFEQAIEAAEKAGQAAREGDGARARPVRERRARGARSSAVAMRAHDSSSTGPAWTSGALITVCSSLSLSYSLIVVPVLCV